MEKKDYRYLLILSPSITLGAVSSALCVASEFKKTKKKDLRLNGRLCYLPGSDAFRMGIAAIVLLCVAQIIGNLVIFKSLYLKGKRKSYNESRSAVSIVLLSLSWISFIIALVIVSAATSMNIRQPYGRGWLDGECYIVKDGVFFGGGILFFLSIGSTITSSIIRMRKSQVEKGPKAHGQFIEGFQ